MSQRIAWPGMRGRGLCLAKIPYLYRTSLVHYLKPLQETGTVKTMAAQMKTVEKDLDPSFLGAFSKLAKPKASSSETHDRDHTLVLAERKLITCLLLGDSMLERFKTTGLSTKFGSSANYPDFFNAGVGGDRISNVIYRLTTKGLLSELRQCGVGYVLLEMGANNLLNDKKPLSQENVEGEYEMVIEALKRACPEAKVLVCGLNPRRRVKREGIVEGE